MLIHLYEVQTEYNPYVRSLPSDKEPSNGYFSNVEPMFIPEHWPCYDITNDEWIQVEDHRGKIGWISGLRTPIHNLGPLPDGWTTEYHEPLVQDLKQIMKKHLTTKRLSVEYSGPLIPIETGSLRFPSTVKDETRLTSLASLFEKNPSLTKVDNWKVAEDVYVTMTPALMDQIKLLGFLHIAASFTIEKMKIVEIENCETLRELTQWYDEKLNVGWDLSLEQLYQSLN